MAKKPDYSHLNTPELKDFCKDMGLKFEWKNQAQKHAIVSSDQVELYVWLQRMATQIRKRNGVVLSNPIMHNGNQRFNKLEFTKLLLTENKPKKGKYPMPHYERGVAVLRLIKGTPKEVRSSRLHELKMLSQHHSRTKAYY